MMFGLFGAASACVAKKSKFSAAITATKESSLIFMFPKDNQPDRGIIEERGYKQEPTGDSLLPLLIKPLVRLIECRNRDVDNFQFPNGAMATAGLDINRRHRLHRK